MIYVFENYDGTASVVYEEESLNDDHKAQGIAVEKLPDVVTQPGKIPVLKCSKETGQVWYDYIDEPKSPTDERLALVEQALLEMMGV